MQKIVANESEPMNRTLPEPDPSKNKIDASLAYHAEPPAPPAPATTDPDGSIIVPAASFAAKNRSAPVSVIKSFLEGTQLLSNGCKSSVGPPCFDPASSAVTYEVTAKAAGSYYLTANFSTWHMDQDLYVSVGGAKAVEVGLFYTVGWWNETQPVEVTLAEGKNTLVFTRTSTRDVMFKDFLLHKKKPTIPPPPGNFTPTPAPPMPSANAYIEVPADTTCEKQGIAPVSAEMCSHACLALGFKSTGARARPDPPGCFVMTTGQYAGNCNYNSNKSAACEPPCKLYGVVTRSLCVRK